MKDNRQTKKLYTTPSAKIVKIECESAILAVSGQGTDTNEHHDLGGRGANERRGEWGYF